MISILYEYLKNIYNNNSYSVKQRDCADLFSKYKECIDTIINKNKDMKCYAILNLYTKSCKYK